MSSDINIYLGDQQIKIGWDLKDWLQHYKILTLLFKTLRKLYSQYLLMRQTLGYQIIIMV